MHVLLNIKFDQEEVINILEMIKDSVSVQTKADDDEKSDVESKSDHETKVDEIDVEGLVKYCSRLTTLKKSASQQSQYENIQIVKRRAALSDPDLLAFHAMVKSLRAQYQASDPETNIGLVVSPTLTNTYTEDTSVKLIIYNSIRNLNFTSSVSASIEHVMLHIVCELDAGSAEDYVLKVYHKNEYLTLHTLLGEYEYVHECIKLEVCELDAGSAEDYVLKVYHKNEYLTLHTLLGEYEYVHECIKLERDIEFTLLHKDQLDRSLARTSQDDLNDAALTLDDLLPKEMIQPISHESLLILLETFESEVERYEKHQKQSKNVVQSVKALCTLLGNVETLEISTALEEFIAADPSTPVSSNVQLGDEVDDNYTFVKLQTRPQHSEQFEAKREKLFEAVQALEEFIAADPSTPVSSNVQLGDEVDNNYTFVKLQTRPQHSEQFEAKREKLFEAVHNLVTMYCHAFRVNFMILPCEEESHRMRNLTSELEGLHAMLQDTPTCLPLSPSLEVGDDLQQDMLTLQMIRIMDKMWLREGLDLKMVTFSCVPTGHKRGIIEMVQDAETLRKIQVELGLTGSFRDRPIAEWLAKHNPSALEYERAVANFTASCAGYSVATYVLGICDRHNDNIMLKTSGHLFHIDYGKFLGDAQMFGNFKRDRTPFVLTPDMVYVILQSSGLTVGRSNIKQVAEKRRHDIKRFLDSLFMMADEICHSDLVYTFFHPLLRDQQDANIHQTKLKGNLQSSGLTVGRSNIKQVAEKRRHDIKRFLDSLFMMADEICHSDLVYTFFHPLLRDQQDANIHQTKLKERKSVKQMESERRSIRGEIKLSIKYERMRNSLTVMVQHVKELPMVGGQEPSSYVKVYLLPDATKSTKRKTKVVKKSCNPSFMENLVYRLPYEIIQHRTLQATVWTHDTL
ncbi:phosphatidylinositol 4-phosphate 3-kinase C2 domain-containing subunit beta-like [Diaphorina citri]|uniref:phosphatidylinositol-4-phosphate 3-kinase n=2 Tax=Diaphorina citri TaxID=121845 RepID=A0A3Q0JFN0_DIACI|nr:phosphatidylinositol 4-phosphate 3-kinase C2 domain-containing subunit beta-like [Diaphorina citri]